MFWQKIGNSVADRLFHDSVIAENQCLSASNNLISTNITLMNTPKIIALLNSVI